MPSILGTIALMGTTVPNVISCHKDENKNDNNTTAKDIEILNDIKGKAVAMINNGLKKIICR